MLCLWQDCLRRKIYPGNILKWLFSVQQSNSARERQQNVVSYLVFTGYNGKPFPMKNNQSYFNVGGEFLCCGPICEGLQWNLLLGKVLCTKRSSVKSQHRIWLITKEQLSEWHKKLFVLASNFAGFRNVLYIQYISYTYILKLYYMQLNNTDQSKVK